MHLIGNLSEILSVMIFDSLEDVNGRITHKYIWSRINTVIRQLRSATRTGAAHKIKKAPEESNLQRPFFGTRIVKFD
jgi:hypothetical protein